jgi:hypothetical protein
MDNYIDQIEKERINDSKENIFIRFKCERYDQTIIVDSLIIENGVFYFTSHITHGNELNRQGKFKWSNGVKEFTPNKDVITSFSTKKINY